MKTNCTKQHDISCSSSNDDSNNDDTSCPSTDTILETIPLYCNSNTREEKQLTAVSSETLNIFEGIYIHTFDFLQ